MRFYSKEALQPDINVAPNVSLIKISKLILKMNMTQQRTFKIKLKINKKKIREDFKYKKSITEIILKEMVDRVLL